MGYYKHHAIVVTAYDHAEEDIKRIHKMCVDSPLPVTDIMKSLNGFLSFMVCPDGSKEGWEESFEGDKWRKRICDELDRQAYDDGSNSFHFVEISYDEDKIAKIERTNSGQPGEEID